MNKNKKQNFTFNGKLLYDQNANYILHSPTSDINLSNILQKTFCYYDNVINIEIRKGYKTLYAEEGHLINEVSKHNILTYHINGADLEEVLFNNVGEYLDIEIYSKRLVELVRQGEVVYGTEQIRS